MFHVTDNNLFKDIVRDFYVKNKTKTKIVKSLNIKTRKLCQYQQQFPIITGISIFNKKKKKPSLFYFKPLICNKHIFV